MSRPRLLIAGGGPVGLATACACDMFDVEVIEAAAARAKPRGDEFEVRVYALSPGTRDFLRDIGAWDRIDARRIAPVRRMDVFGDRGAKLTFSPRPGGALAWIVEAGRMSDAIAEAAGDHASVRVRHGAQAIGFSASAEGASIELEGGERIAGDLLVGADGPDSRVRERLGIAFEERPFGETAVVANFETERDHEAVARQWFREDGVLAWLPLPGRRMSIVWSTPSAHSEELARLEPRDLERRVRDAGESTLGDLRLISAVARFPLRSIDVPNPVVAGAALVGDAAHTVHPLAGQGVNLGFQDARLLAQVLADRSALERPGDLRVLRRYARSRREDVTAMDFVTRGLDGLFASRLPGASGARNAALRLVDAVPRAKLFFTRRAMR